MTTKWVLAIACAIGLFAGGRDVSAQGLMYPGLGYAGLGSGYGSYGWGYGGYGLGYSLGYGYGLNYAGYGGYYSPYGWSYGYPYGYGFPYGYGGYGFGYGYPYGYGYGYGGYPYGLGWGGMYSPYGWGGYAGYYGGFGYPWGFFAPSYFNYGSSIYSSPIVQQPVFGNSDYVGRSPVISMPQLNSPQFSSSVPATTVDNGEIVVFSPPSNTGEVQYNLNGMTYTMKPGTLQRFRNDRSWVIEINDGTGQVLKYALTTGTYKFKQSNSTFGLYTSDDKPDGSAPAVNPPETVPPKPSGDTAVPAPAPNIP